MLHNNEGLIISKKMHAIYFYKIVIVEHLSSVCSLYIWSEGLLYFILNCIFEYKSPLIYLRERFLFENTRENITQDLQTGRHKPRIIRVHTQL